MEKEKVVVERWTDGEMYIAELVFSDHSRIKITDIDKEVLEEKVKKIIQKNAASEVDLDGNEVSGDD